MAEETISREELADYCYLALRRPAMMWGVPAMGCVINVSCSMCTGAWFGLIMGHPWLMFPWMFLMGFSIHIAMKQACNRDPNLFNILTVWLETKANRALNSKFGGSSASPLPTSLPRKSGDFPIAFGRDWHGWCDQHG